MKGQGASEIGVYRFLHVKTQSPASGAGFTELWRCQDGAWKLSRIIRYDQTAPKKQVR